MNDDLKVIHKADLDMLKAVVEIFNKYGLDYFLIAGTLLGAVRHGGFIPWDDDLDIGVPRESYDLFLEKYADQLPKRYMVQNYKTDINAKYYVTKILDTDIEVKEIRDESDETSKTFASIDLFPIDGTPNGKLHRKLFIYRILFLRMLASFSQSDNIDMSRNRNQVEKILVKIAKSLPFNKIINRNAVYQRIDKTLKKNSINNSQLVGSLMGAYREKELFDSHYINKLKLLKFEDSMFRVPVCEKEYLKHMYGDYMKIPDEDKIEAKRHFVISK